MTILFTGNFIVDERNASWRRVQAIREHVYANIKDHHYAPLRLSTLGVLFGLLSRPKAHKIERIYVYNKSFLTNVFLVLWAKLLGIPVDFDLVEYGERRKGIVGRAKVFDEYLSFRLPAVHHSKVFAISEAIQKLPVVKTYDVEVLPPLLNDDDASIIEQISQQTQKISGRIGILSKDKVEDDLRRFVSLVKGIADPDRIVIIGLENAEKFGLRSMAPASYHEYLAEVAGCDIIILPRADSPANKFSSPTRIAELVLMERACILPKGFARYQAKVRAHVVEYDPASDQSILGAISQVIS